MAGLKKKNTVFNRYTAIIIIMMLLFSFVAVRLAQIQIVNADEYMDRANTNAIRHIPENAPRGKIIDRNGAVLADNKQSYNLVYMETDEGKEKFYDTFKEVFALLEKSVKKEDDGSESKEALLDEFQLKVNPYRFEFNCKEDDIETKRSMELFFKKERGLNDVVRLKYYKNKTGEELTNQEKEKINEEVLKISPEEVFKYLIVKHDLWQLLKLSKEEAKELFKKRDAGEIKNSDIADMVLDKYSPEELRKFMVVKDTLYFQSFLGYKPITIAANISQQTAFLFEQVKNNLPGIDISLQTIRYYPQKELGCNFIGYISKINATDEEKYKERGYDVSADYIGTAGLESAFEDRLRGSKGGTTVKINKEGRKTEELFRLEAYPGQDMVLTIDSKLQAVTERALKERMEALQADRYHQEGKGTMDTGNATRGAAVVIDVNTGAVLSLVSLPGYDPNIFSVPGKLTKELNKQFFYPDYEGFAKNYIGNMKINKSVDELFEPTTLADGSILRKDSYDIYPKPFFNYATSAVVPPGSTFKPLTAIAALEEGVVSSKETIYDHVHFTIPGATNTWSCHSSYGHGKVDVKRALEKSCNYYFYEVGNKLYKKNGLDSLASYAWRFGLGVDPNTKAKATTGLEINEAFGQVYNNTTSENDAAFYSKFKVDAVLKAGRYDAGNGARVFFTAIDISTNKQDSDDLASAKEAIKVKVREYITEEKKDIYFNLKADLIPLFKDFIEALPEGLKSNYKSSDPSNMAEAIANLVAFDVMTQVKTPGNIFNAAIGQGASNFTPVQLTNYMATIANGGTRYNVHLVDKFLDYNGNVIEEFKPQVMDKIDLKPNTMEAVFSGLEAVTDESGTAASAFSDKKYPFPIATGGKTGSATYKEGGVQEAVGRTSYGLYLGFAPLKDPKIAVCVVIFDAGHGGYVADTARAIYEAYFREELKQTPGFIPKFDYTLNP